MALRISQEPNNMISTIMRSSLLPDAFLDALAGSGDADCGLGFDIW
jgi:hypothetical protein